MRTRSHSTRASRDGPNEAGLHGGSNATRHRGAISEVGRLLNQSRFGPYLYGMVSTMAVQVAELVQAAATGDEAAFTELVSRHHRDMLRVAYVICRDPALAEDSAQAAWAIAWRRMGDVKDPTQIRGWLVAVAANEARRTMRSRRPSVHEISVGDIELEGVPDFRSDPLADSIASSDLRRVLASLDPTDRALIALRYVAELSSDEIGRALGMSSSGARGRLSRLLLRLRGELAMNDFDQFERRLAAALRSDADESVGPFEAGSIARAAIARRTSVRASAATVRPGPRHDASRGRSPVARRWGVGGGLRPPAAAVGRPACACTIGRLRSPRHRQTRRPPARASRRHHPQVRSLSRVREASGSPTGTMVHASLRSHRGAAPRWPGARGGRLRRAANERPTT